MFYPVGVLFLLHHDGWSAITRGRSPLSTAPVLPRAGKVG
jgi:hypothetical protein